VTALAEALAVSAGTGVSDISGASALRSHLKESSRIVTLSLPIKNACEGLRQAKMMSTVFRSLESCEHRGGECE